MPSLMPGMPGTKEAFAISLVKDDLSVQVPPKALAHYKISGSDEIVLTTGHKGKSGFGLIKKETALKAVFGKFVKQIENRGQVYRFNDRAYVMLEINNGMFRMTDDILKAFYLKPGHRLLVVKSTTVTISFTPVEIWKENLKKHGFDEAITNMEKLDVF